MAKKLKKKKQRILPICRSELKYILFKLSREEHLETLKLQWTIQVTSGGASVEACMRMGDGLIPIGGFKASGFPEQSIPLLVELTEAATSKKVQWLVRRAQEHFDLE